MNEEVKKKLFDKCQDLLKERIRAIQVSISNIQIALESETKSSAGDKHETGRAMLQLDIEKLGNQLSKAENELILLKKIPIGVRHSKVGFGSVVKTSLNNYFLATSLGLIKLENSDYYAISMETPMAKLLKSKEKNDVLKFREQEFCILEVG